MVVAPVTGEPAYWNHNTAYHRWIARKAASHAGRVLDVGCGDGLLASRLAGVSRSVVGIDPDASAIERATSRTRAHVGVRFETAGFDQYDPPAGSFELVVFVASLHHMDTRESLKKARSLLVPGGELLVVGLSANRDVSDWAISAVSLPFVKLGSWIHGETRDVGVVTAAPQESLGEIRAMARAELPGARIRRGLYYRYLLRWRKPATS